MCISNKKKKEREKNERQGKKMRYLSLVYLSRSKKSKRKRGTIEDYAHTHLECITVLTVDFLSIYNNLTKKNVLNKN